MARAADFAPELRLAGCFLVFILGETRQACRILSRDFIRTHPSDDLIFLFLKQTG
jgi:hypothetical protein